jgi:hypothetical protein
MVSISLTASQGSIAVVVVNQGRAAFEPSFPRAQNNKAVKVEKSIKMSWSMTAVERRSARFEVWLGSSVPEVLQAKGIAD